MLRPFLFVGCGGSGNRTIRLIRRGLEQRLRELGYSGQFPEAWQFLAIDVPISDDTESDLQTVPVDYVPLTDPFTTYRESNGADRTLATERGIAAAMNFVEWRPNPMNINVSLGIGAGQHRAVGRVAVATYGAVVKTHLDQAIAACTRGASELPAVAREIGINLGAGATAKQPLAIVVSSLAGGAGAGMFLDVADMIRMNSGGQVWLQELVGILYDPSVFDRDGVIVQSGVAPNSLAAVSELVAGQWSPWKKPPFPAGFNGSLGAMGGIEFPFLVGSGNSSVSYSDPMQVYAATASALTSWVIRPDLAAAVEQSTRGNWSSNGAKSRIELHGGSTTRMPLSSIGFARLTLGRQRFKSYASERAVRECMVRLLTCHHNDDVREGRKTDKQAAEERALTNDKALIRDTLERMGLYEHTGRVLLPGKDPITVDSNQVLDAIRNLEEVTRQASVDADSLSRHVKGDKSSIVSQITQLFDVSSGAGVGIRSGIRARQEAAGLAWAEQIQTSVLQETARLVAAHGLVVAEVVLSTAIELVGAEFPLQLRSEKTGITAQSLWEAVGDVAELMRRNRIDSALRKTIAEVVAARIIRDCEIDARDLAAELLEDIAQGLLTPLRDALRDSIELAKLEQRSPEFKDLADRSVPNRLQPPPNEVLIEQPDTYAQRYDDLFAATAKTVDQALALIISGTYEVGGHPETKPGPLCAWEATKWVPKLAERTEVRGTPSVASVQLATSMAELRERAEHWISHDPQTPIGRFVGTGLRQYMSENPSRTAAAQRAAELSDGLNTLFDKAAPLVQLTGQWALTKFGLILSNMVEYHITRLPLADGDPGYADATTILRARLGRDGVADLFGSSSNDDIEVFAALKPVPPSAIGSLVFPITAQWHADAPEMAETGNDSKFWLGRRGRPLLETVPLPMSSRITLARGWVTGNVLGLIRAPREAGPVRLHRDGVDYDFLTPWLTASVSNSFDWFGGVLEGTMLAEMLAATGELGPLEALTELLRLGSDRDTPTANSQYESLHPLLIAHIEKWDEQMMADLATQLNTQADSLEKNRAAYQPTAEYEPYPLRHATAELLATALRSIAMALRARELAATEPVNPLAGGRVG